MYKKVEDIVVLESERLKWLIKYFSKCFNFKFIHLILFKNYYDSLSDLAFYSKKTNS